MLKAAQFEISKLCKKGYKFEKITSNYKGIGNKISYKFISNSS